MQPQLLAEPRRPTTAHPQAVREHIRKMAVGGPQSKEDKAAVYEISDSEEEGELSATSGNLTTTGDLERMPSG